MSVSEIGRRLKNARLNCHMTQAEVAKKLGVTYQAISNYERGTTQVSTDTLSRLCLIYQIPVSRLLVTPAWDEDMFEAYRSAKSDKERQRYFDLWGIPAELMEAANNLREPDPFPITPLDEAVLYTYHHASAEDRAIIDVIIRKYIPHSESDPNSSAEARDATTTPTLPVAGDKERLLEIMSKSPADMTDEELDMFAKELRRQSLEEKKQVSPASSASTSAEKLA